MSVSKILRSRDGQSIIEISLITPLLLAALYVAADFGILFFTAHYAQNAVREGARIGSVLPDCAIDASIACVGSTSNQSCPGTSTGTGTLVAEVCNRLPNMLTTKQVSVTLTGVYFPATCMREVKVIASGTYNYGFYRVMNLFGFPVPSTTSITRSADTRYQAQPVTVTGAC
jgi:Flp pilus assembly protein TadG